MTKNRILMATMIIVSVVSAGLTAMPLASAAHCSASLPAGEKLDCYSDGRGACGAAVYHGGSGSGAGCFAADY